MEYTLNKEQIKFLEAVLGGMTNDDVKKYILLRHTEKEAREILGYVEKDIHVDIYCELNKIIYD